MVVSSRVQLPSYLSNNLGKISAPGAGRIQSDPVEVFAKRFSGHNRFRLLIVVSINQSNSRNFFRHVLVEALPSPDLVSHSNYQRVRHRSSWVLSKQLRTDDT